MEPREPSDAYDGEPEPGPLDLDALTRKFQKELNSGLIALVLLSILDRAGEDLYGYQIAKQLQGEAGDEAIVKQGALYPVLRTMSSQGLLTSRVVPSLAGPPRRYYRITELGRATLARWLDIWTRTRGFVDATTRTPTPTPADSRPQP
jgi:PadR family transcriptional regulator PadR